MNRYILLALLLITSAGLFCQNTIPTTGDRAHLLLDRGWLFAYGHPYDTKKDFNNGTGYFSYFAKTGYGDGAAAANFDDRAWRKLDIPHDWAVEQGFDSTASYSHGFKTIGRNFPATSVGWYRKKINIPETDFGKHISIAFDGVFRNCMVWVNGFYLGTELSGYNSFEYNIAEYLNYGGENTIAVRVDATMEEGWFYEGAGIYRHVWLNKSAPLHIATNGTCITSKVTNNMAAVTAQVALLNEGKIKKTVEVIQTIVNATGKIVATDNIKNCTVTSFEDKNFSSTMQLANPTLWSLETPYLYKLVTTIVEEGKTIDTYETNFGIRFMRFDSAEGFFLNGKHVKIHGTNNHQDHAGVGVAMPDALQEFRVNALKAIGCNAYRCSHNPPTPELLDACDKLGMLVIDETRLMGVNATHLSDIKKMILRDRNHPSVISWSIGNEEWRIEGNELGARIASTMQAFVKSIDTTHFITAAVSGGWRKGISNVIDVMGYNYIAQINTDTHHAEFPHQPSWGTEEGSTYSTRGVYVDDEKQHWLSAYDKKPRPTAYSIEEGWKHYAERNYLAGMFIWTGFDYRGEPSPFQYPSVSSYFGMLDACGFAKDDVYYLKSWWTNIPTLHILPHWNWKGKEGQPIDVWTHSNCDEVELFLNKKSMGKKTMLQNGHLEWKVNYAPGILEAVGYKKGKKIVIDIVKTTSEPVAIQIAAEQTTIKANYEDIATLTIDVKDKNNLQVPIADNEIAFSIQGPAKIIGVGNGNPISLEPDKYIETINVFKIENLKEKVVSDINSNNETVVDYNDANWAKAFTADRDEKFGQTVKALVYRGTFNLPENYKQSTITFFYNSLGKQQSVFVNGKLLAENIKEDPKGNTFVLDASLLHAGENSVAIAAMPLLKKHQWDAVNQNPGLVQLVTPAAAWKRKLFNGLAQLIIQTTGEAGEITVQATGTGLKTGVLKIKSIVAPLRAHVQ